MRLEMADLEILKETEPLIPGSDILIDELQEKIDNLIAKFSFEKTQLIVGRMDSDSNGKITGKEFSQFMKRTFLEGVESGEISQSSAESSVSLEERLEAFEECIAEGSEIDANRLAAIIFEPVKMLREASKDTSLDGNSDGRITQIELEDAMARAQKSPLDLRIEKSGEKTLLPNQEGETRR